MYMYGGGEGANFRLAYIDFNTHPPIAPGSHPPNAYYEYSQAHIDGY